MHGSRGGIPMSLLSHRRLAAVLGAAFGACCAGPVQAQIQPKATSLEPVFVTATRFSQPLAELIADVTTIGPDDIAHAGAQSLSDVLARLPGVEIATNGGPGSTSSVFLRGANRGHTLVLIDGLRVGSSSDGATALEAIPLDEIDHIEILRGPASSLYGADAIGGVIQIRMQAGVTAPTAPAWRRQGSRAAPARTDGGSRCRRACVGARASTRSATPRISAITPIAMGIGTTARAAASRIASRRIRSSPRSSSAAG
ncbi:MAG: TonB-dependent receptor [Betaproteobacteria bacterium]|nr:MAG: TonB-dependent receptor [Betaproteobacteria bacterium]